MEKENKLMSLFVIKKKIITSIVGVYVCMVFLVFPLYYHNNYYDLTEMKYKVYYISAIGTAMLILIVVTVFRGRCGKSKKRSYTSPDIAVAMFFVSMVISTVFSKYLYEAFWGNEGNWMGLFLTMVMLMTYCYIGRGLEFRKWYLDLFLVACLFVACLGIAHYWGIDPLGLKEGLQEKQKNIFASTIGNINQYTAYMAMPAAISSVLFATAEKRKVAVWYYICMIVSFVALILGISDNAYLTFGALFLSLPLYLFTKKEWLKRYCVIIVTFVTTVWIATTWSHAAQGTMPTDGIFSALAEGRINKYVILGLWLFIALMYFLDLDRTKKVRVTSSGWITGKVLRRWWIGLICVLAVVLIGMLVDANLLEHKEHYGTLSKYLRFSDEWGSYRGWAWKTGFRIYGEFPLLQKIFGSGPETFGIIMVRQYWEEMAQITQQKFLTAHNQYIQYLVTIGISGLVTYLGMWFTSIYWMVKKSGNNKKYVMPIVYALVCYGTQAMVNFDTPIVTPILWTLVFVGLAGCRQCTDAVEGA